MISFYKRSNSQFATAKSNNSLVQDGIYFITDTGEIYVASSVSGAVKYAQNQVKIISSTDWATENYFSNAEVGVLYIDETGLQKVKASGGSNWITVNVPSADSITNATSGMVPTVAAVSSYVANVQAKASGLEARISNTIGSDTPASALVTAEAVSGYADVKGAASTAESNAKADALKNYLSKIEFSNATGALSSTLSGVTTEVATLSGLLRSASYESGKLSLGVTGGDAITVDIPAEQFLSAVKYCKITEDMLANGIASGDASGFANDNVPASVFTGKAKDDEGILFQFAVNNDSDADIESYTYTFVPYTSLIQPYTAGAKAATTPVKIVVDKNTRKITAEFSHDTTLKMFETGELSGKLGVDTAVVSAAIQDVMVDYVEANAIIPSASVSGLTDYLTTNFALKFNQASWDAAISANTASGSFATADTMATEKSVKSYVSGFVADELAGFLTSLSMSQYAKHAATGHADEIAILDADGNVLSSGFKVGGTTATAFGSEVKVALESAVSAYVTGLFTELRGGDTGALSGKIDKVTGATGKLGKFTESGNLESTGFTIGAEAVTGFGASGELATEMAVSGYFDQEIAKALAFN